MASIFEKKFSVRSLVEFLLRTGDLDNRIQAPSDAMAAGSRLHKKLQKQGGADYHAEVPLAGTFVLAWKEKEARIRIEGRADGIVLQEGEVPMIDEIKGTYRSVTKMKEPNSVHLAQAKLYAFLYARQEKLPQIRVRMTYGNLDTEKIRCFENLYFWSEMEDFFQEILSLLRPWIEMEAGWQEVRTASILQMHFPFSWREGQKKLAAGVYRTIDQKKKLFLEAPTGSGKTLAVLYPALKAVGEEKADRIFYLTAKTMTAAVAQDAYRLLRQKGNLRFKTVTLTAKEKICPNPVCECNPDDCPYARGHFDRVNRALFSLLNEKEEYTWQVVLEKARSSCVCPFELSLDLSLFCDGIICDYNYLFDPFVYLKRFFLAQTACRYLFLIDEAHNLLERGREMYSAELAWEEFSALRTALRKELRKERGFSRVLEELEKAENVFSQIKAEKFGKTKSEISVVERIDSFADHMTNLHRALTSYLDQHRAQAKNERLLAFFFRLNRFLVIYDKSDQRYRYIVKDEKGERTLRILCLDPSEDLKACMGLGRASILFSATFLPIQYYKQLLGGTQEDYEIYAETAFDADRCVYLISKDVTAKYTARSMEMYRKTALYIRRVAASKRGNYLVFFPSFAYLERTRQVYEEEYRTRDTEILCQRTGMTQEEKERFLNSFSEGNRLPLEDQIHFDLTVVEDRTLIGFCVMGGIFGEGIDLRGESLIGVIVVGCGIPQVGFSRNLLKEYFDDCGKNGYDYAYRFPGIHKVLQAAGRVIRTEEDAGVVVLLDDRFFEKGYQALFPREWRHQISVTTNTVNNELSNFWKKMNDNP